MELWFETEHLNPNGKPKERADAELLKVALSAANDELEKALRRSIPTLSSALSRSTALALVTDITMTVIMTVTLGLV